MGGGRREWIITGGEGVEGTAGSRYISRLLRGKGRWCLLVVAPLVGVRIGVMLIGFGSAHCCRVSFFSSFSSCSLWPQMGWWMRIGAGGGCYSCNQCWCSTGPECPCLDIHRIHGGVHRRRGRSGLFQHKLVSRGGAVSFPRRLT